MKGKKQLALALVLGIILSATLGLFAIPRSAANESSEGEITLTVERNYYARAQTVNLTLTNTGNAELVGTPAITIHKIDGTLVTSVPTLAMLYTLQPAQSINFTWNGKDSNGNAVAEGEYIAMAKFGGAFSLSTFKIGVGSTKSIYTITLINKSSHQAEIYVWNSGTTTITGYFHFYAYNSNGDLVYAYTTTKKYSLSPGSYGVHYWDLNSNTGLSVSNGDYYIVCAITNPSYSSHHAICHEMLNL